MLISEFTGFNLVTSVVLIFSKKQVQHLHGDMFSTIWSVGLIKLLPFKTRAARCFTAAQKIQHLFQGTVIEK